MTNVFENAHFRIYQNGGGTTAWRRDVDSSFFVLITDAEGFSCESACKIDPLGWGIGVQF